MKSHAVWALAAACSLLASISGAAGQAPKTRTIWDGIYTEAQAARGEKAYKAACGYCHKDNLAGGFFDDGNGRAPALSGARAFDSSFEKRWAGKTVGDMVIEIGTAMPQTDPGSLAPETYVDIITFLLAQNGVPAGTAELAPELDALQGVRITPKP
jgi:hypothetical protein